MTILFGVKNYKRKYKFYCNNCKKKDSYVEKVCSVHNQEAFTSLEKIEKDVSRFNDLGYPAKVGFLCKKCQSKFNNKKAFFEIEYNGKINSCYNDADTKDYFIVYCFLGIRSRYSNDNDCLARVLEGWSAEEHDYVKNVLKTMLGLEGI